MKAEDIRQLISDWLENNARKADDSYVCKRCGGTLWGQGKRLSVHEMEAVFGTHAGFGETREVVFPYCRNCDKDIGYASEIICISG